MNNGNNYKNISQYLDSPKGGGIAFTIMTFAYLMISFIGQTLVGAIFGTGNTAYVLICALFPALTFLVVIIYFISQTKKPLLKTVGLNKFNNLYLILAVLISASMFFGLGFINDAFVDLLKKCGVIIKEVNISIETPFQLVAYTFTYALLPAVFEEFFFRGLLLNCLKGVKHIAVILTVGLCFALYHNSLAQLIYQFAYGAVLTALALACGSVIPCIIAHFINNFTVIVLQYFKEQLNLLNPLCIAIGVVGLILVSLVMFFALSKKKTDKSNKISGFYLFAWCGIIICLVLAIGSIFAPTVGS